MIITAPLSAAIWPIYVRVEGEDVVATIRC